jgi:alpha/beta superfamily hydrolase
MREFPVWIPVGEERLSATITVPDGEPRGLVLLMPGGGGAPRSHRYAMFTTVARELAPRGIASARMDWQGIGDSTGRASYRFHALPGEAAAEIARFAMKATGTSTFGMAGNCGGARTALLTLPMIPEASSAVLMMLKPLTGTRSEKQSVRKAKRMVRGIPKIGRMLRGAYWAMRWRKGNPVLDRVKALSPAIDILFLEASTVKVGRLPKFVEELKAKAGKRRLELRFFPGGATRAFQSLERQDFALEGMIDWFDRTLPGSAPTTDSRPATAPAAARS